MADVRQRTIIKVRLGVMVLLVAYTPLTRFLFVQVFRKYSNSLGPDALQIIEGILDSHEIEDADVESSLETLAKEYNKQDGASNIFYSCT